MPVGICGKCGNPCPDSVHRWTVECKCIDWEQHYKDQGYNPLPSKNDVEVQDTAEFKEGMRKRVREFLVESKGEVVLNEEKFLEKLEDKHEKKTK